MLIKIIIVSPNIIIIVEHNYIVVTLYILVYIVEYRRNWLLSAARC